MGLAVILLTVLAQCTQTSSVSRVSIKTLDVNRNRSNAPKYASSDILMFISIYTDILSKYYVPVLVTVEQTKEEASKKNVVIEDALRSEIVKFRSDRKPSPEKFDIHLHGVAFQKSERCSEFFISLLDNGFFITKSKIQTFGDKDFKKQAIMQGDLSILKILYHLNSQYDTFCLPLNLPVKNLLIKIFAELKYHIGILSTVVGKADSDKLANSLDVTYASLVSLLYFFVYDEKTKKDVIPKNLNMLLDKVFKSTGEDYKKLEKKFLDEYELLRKALFYEKWSFKKQIEIKKDDDIGEDGDYLRNTLKPSLYIIAVDLELMRSIAHVVSNLVLLFDREYLTFLRISYAPVYSMMFPSSKKITVSNGERFFNSMRVLSSKLMTFTLKRHLRDDEKEELARDLISKFPDVTIERASEKTPGEREAEKEVIPKEELPEEHSSIEQSEAEVELLEEVKPNVRQIAYGRVTEEIEDIVKTLSNEQSLKLIKITKYVDKKILELISIVNDLKTTRSSMTVTKVTLLVIACVDILLTSLAIFYLRRNA